MQRIRCQRCGEIWEILAVVDARFTGDIDRDNTVFVLRHHEVHDLGLVPDYGNLELVVSRAEDDIVEHRDPDRPAID